MGSLVFQAWDEDDLPGAPLGTLEDPTDKSILLELYGIGAAEFTLSRHSDERNLCRPGRYITVHLDNVANAAIFGFFVTQSRNVVLSESEQGAEVFRRSGEGVMSVLADAIVWYKAVTDRDAAVPTEDNEYWQWTAAMNAHPAGVMVRMLEEAQERGCFPFLSYDFTRDEDSNGDPWTVALDDFRLDIGTDLLTVAAKIMQLGIVFVMDPDFTLHAYETEPTRRGAPSFGTDLTATLTFAAADNIATAAEQHQFAPQAKSSVLVKGTRSDNGETAWVATDSAAGLAELKRRKEGFLDAGDAKGFTNLQTMGLESIYSKLRLRDGASYLGVYDTSNVPFDDYNLGDSVLVDVPGVWDEEERVIMSLGFVDTEAGEYDVIVGFDQTSSLSARAAVSPSTRPSRTLPPGNDAEMTDRAEGSDALMLDDVDEFDDVNLSDGTVTDGGGSIGAFSNPSNANDGDYETTASRGVHVTGAGTHTLALKSDLGASMEVVSHELYGDIFTGWGDTIVFQTSADGNAPWTTVPSTSYVTGGSGNNESLVYTHDPETARYWRMLHSRTVSGLSSLGSVYVRTWAINADAGTGSQWVVDAGNVVDGDDATYETITDTDLVRVDLGAAHRIVRTRIRIATTNAGARTFTIKGANLADFSDEATLTTIAFTATGGLTAQDVTGQWINTTAYRYYELSIGTSDTFRVHAWELYEATPGAIIVEDPTNGGAPDDLQDVLDNIAAEGASAHIADPTDAHDASAISVADAGGHFTGTDVEAALQELGAATSDTDLRMADIETHHRFIITAHMGDVNPTDGYPEGSLEGYRQAVRKGCHRVDLDLRQSSAGTWYIMHDATLNRTTNLSGNISSASDATLDGGHIDGGTGYDAGRHGSSIGIPTLAEVIEALAPYDCTFQFDNKLTSDASAESLAAIAQAAGISHRVVMNCYGGSGQESALEAVAPEIGIIGSRATANDWATPDWDDVVSLSYVYGNAPRKVSGVVPRGDYGTADEEAIVEQLWGYGARGITSNDIEVAVATWQRLEYGEGVTDHGALSGLSDDDHAQYLTEARHDALDHEGGVLPLTAVVDGIPMLVWDDDLSLIPTEI